MPAHQNGEGLLKKDHITILDIRCCSHCAFFTSDSKCIKGDERWAEYREPNPLDALEYREHRKLVSSTVCEQFQSKFKRIHSCRYCLFFTQKDGGFGCHRRPEYFSRYGATIDKDGVSSYSNSWAKIEARNTGCSDYLDAEILSEAGVTCRDVWRLRTGTKKRIMKGQTNLDLFA